MTQISQRAVDLIVRWEISSPAAYRPRPGWPGGGSGVTIGIGYDLGYVGAQCLRVDWGGLLPLQDVVRLGRVCGLRGLDARAVLDNVRDIAVPLEAARWVFMRRSLPVHIAYALDAFPGAEALPPDALGALVSLIYNRGTAMESEPGDKQDRRREMRLVRDAVAAGRFGEVPAAIRAMSRLWPDSTGVGGLRGRREDEAALFEAGIAALQAEQRTVAARGDAPLEVRMEPVQGAGG